jgi:hypothetical protein
VTAPLGSETLDHLDLPMTQPLDLAELFRSEAA